jgi:hypothetical protein
MPHLTAFSDDFPGPGFDSAWLLQPRTHAIALVSPAMQVSVAAGADATLTSQAFPCASLLVGRERNFCLEVVLSDLAVTSGANRCVVGIGLYDAEASGAGNAELALVPIVEFGGTTAGNPLCFFSLTAVNDVGGRCNVAYPGGTVFIRVFRLDNVVYAEHSPDGAAWSPFATEDAALTLLRRFMPGASVIDAPAVALYARSAHAVDSAGVTAKFRAVRLTTWNRFSDAPALGNLQSHTAPEGGSILLDWVNPPAGPDQIRSITVVRSQLGPPEFLPEDRVVEGPALLDANMQVPAAQPLPTSSQDWASKFGSLPPPSIGWVFGDDAPLEYEGIASSFGAGTLQNVGGLLASSERVGLHTGDLARKYAPEFLNSASSYLEEVQALASLTASGNNDFTLYMVLRVARPVTSTACLASNIDATQGWYASLLSTGAIRFTIRSSGIDTSVDTAQTGYDDGGWHAVSFGVSWLQGKLRVWGDAGAIVTTDVPSMVAAGSGVFRVGAGATFPSAPFQLAAVYGWEGAVVSNVTEDFLRALWSHGLLPFTLPVGTTATYVGSLAAGEWGWADLASLDGQVRVAKWSGPPSSGSYRDAQLRMGFNPRYAHASRMDARFSKPLAVSNHFVDSEGVGGCTATNATQTASQYPAPTGLTTAFRLSQTGIDGRTFCAATGLAAATTYTFSVYLRSAAGPGHKATIWLRDGADGTSVDQKHVVYVQPYWTRYSFSVSTGAGTSIGVRIYGGLDNVDSDKSVYVFGRMLHQGQHLTDYAPSPPLAVGPSRAQPVLTLALPAPVVTDFGEVQVTVATLVPAIAEVRSIVDFRSSAVGSPDADRRSVDATASDMVAGSAWSQSGGFVGTVSSAPLTLTTPRSIHFGWSASSPFPGGFGSLGLRVDGAYSHVGSSFTPGPNGVDLVTVGCASGGGTPWQGGIARIALHAGIPSWVDVLVPNAVGRDPLGSVILTTEDAQLLLPGVPVSFVDSAVTEGVFYYYGLFPSRVPLRARTFSRPTSTWHRLVLGAGDTDLGPGVRNGNAVSSLCAVDYAAIDDGPANGTGAYLYRQWPREYRRHDEADRRNLGKPAGLLADYSLFMQRGIDLLRNYAIGLRNVGNPEIAPMGLMGKATNLTAIADQVLAERGVNPGAAGLLSSAKRRLWGGIVPVLKRKGTLGSIVSLVELLTGWRAVVSLAPATDGELRFLRTWDGVTTRTVVSVLQSDVSVSAGFLDFGSSFSMNPGQFAGSLLVDWFGNVKKVRSNTATVLEFSDTTYVAEFERVIVGTVSAGVVTTTVSLNDDQYNGGYVYQSGAAVGRLVTDTVSLTKTVAAAGLVNGGSQQLAVAHSFAGSSYSTRDPRMHASLYSGEHSHLYEPGSVLDLRGLDDDPFFTLWPGLTPTGSGSSYPVTQDDVIVFAPAGAAVVANCPVWSTSADGLTCVIDGYSANAKPGDYLNPNRNQDQWFRIVAAYPLGGRTALQVVPVTTIGGSSLVVSDVAALGDLATVVPRITVEHDRAIRSLISLVLTTNARLFVYYQ